MSEFDPVATMADLNNLDDDDIVAGYRYGMRCATAPGSDKSRSYWHGWRNSQIDFGRLPIDAAATQLVREYLGNRVSGH